ncbi:MAG: hypothetical protein CMN75_06895 [Spirochaeta sp.]|nr:hypothetical protein [Spirochaeta sp.]RPG04016.1 MAG: hypothetical protein CBC32_015100 [Proteobacteria bacterium TMED72]
MAEHPQAQVQDGQSRPAETTGQQPVLSRYARLSAVENTAKPAMDVDSREIPPDQGPEKVSPVERLPSQLEAKTRPQKRASFWKRITMPRVQNEANETPPPAAISLEPVLNRMLALEKQMAANQSATELRIEQFEENLTRLWELEEKLAQAELRERLALLQANQEEIADALHTTGRNLIVLASLVGAALIAGGLGVLFLL